MTKVTDSGWAYLKTGSCVWYSELNDGAATGWFLGIVVAGATFVFGGVKMVQTMEPQRNSKFTYP